MLGLAGRASTIARRPATSQSAQRFIRSYATIGKSSVRLNSTAESAFDSIQALPNLLVFISGLTLSNYLIRPILHVLKFFESPFGDKIFFLNVLKFCSLSAAELFRGSSGRHFPMKRGKRGFVFNFAECCFLDQTWMDTRGGSRESGTCDQHS
jgi:hypothetical protein